LFLLKGYPAQTLLKDFPVGTLEVISAKET